MPESKLPLVKLIDVAVPRNRSIKTFSGERVYIATGDLLGNQINLDSAEVVDFENRPSRASQETNPGDVIFAKMQATDKSLIIDEENSKHIYSSGFFILEPTERILSEYLYHFLRSKSFHTQKDKNCSGATQKAITLEGLQNINIPLPSLEEQKTIIAKLDKLTELIDLKKETIGKTEELTKSVFQEMFGDPVMNEKGWKFYSVEEVCERIVDCPHSTPVFEKEGKYCMDTTCIKPGFIDFQKIRYVSAETFEKRNLRMIPRAGDILFSREGALLGIAAIIPEGIDLCLGQRIMIFRVKKDLVLSKYFESVFNSNSFKLSYKGKVGGSASPHLNIAEIRKFLIPIPPIALQENFSKIAIGLEAVIENQNNSLQELKNLYNTTTQEIFTTNS